jgi:hypothetical protein
MPPHRAFPPYYANSWALVVGINDYQKTPPLLYARSDAQGVADVLTGRCRPSGTTQRTVWVPGGVSQTPGRHGIGPQDRGR